MAQVQYSERESLGSRERLAPPSSSSESLGQSMIDGGVWGWPCGCGHVGFISVEKSDGAMKKKNTKNWYTIDALGAFFAIFTILLQYYYNTFIILL